MSTTKKTPEKFKLFKFEIQKKVFSWKRALIDQIGGFHSIMAHLFYRNWHFLVSFIKTFVRSDFSCLKTNSKCNNSLPRRGYCVEVPKICVCPASVCLSVRPSVCSHYFLDQKSALSRAITGIWVVQKLTKSGQNDQKMISEMPIIARERALFSVHFW